MSSNSQESSQVQTKNIENLSKVGKNDEEASTMAGQQQE